MGTHTRSSDETGCSTMATISFQCREKDVDGKKKLEVQVLSCKGLPDLDGAFNETDAYVVVRLGAGTDKPQKTEAVSGSLNPTFDPASSTFTFDNGPLVGEHARIRFQVMDKDTFSADDLCGKASIKLSKVDKTGKTNTLELVSPADGETHLSHNQTTAIYSLFRTLDKEGGRGELDAFIVDKDGDGKVSFGEFLEQFRMHEDPGNTE